MYVCLCLPDTVRNITITKVRSLGGNLSFSVLKHKPKVGVEAFILYDSYDIAKHIPVHIVLST